MIREQETTVFICEEELDGMLTAIWKALSYRKNGIRVAIHIGPLSCQELFCRYLSVKTHHETAALAMETIRSSLSEEVCELVVHALHHFDEKRADTVLRFLELGFQKGRRIADQMALPEVMRMQELSRKAWHEAHMFTGFVRFEDRNGCLISRIEPKCNVLPLIGEHFHERLSGENWIIVDENRGSAALQERLKDWYMVLDEDVLGSLPENGNHPLQDDYERLWHLFFRTISVEARENPCCQRNLMPLWYRRHMTELNTAAHDSCKNPSFTPEG